IFGGLDLDTSSQFSLGEIDNNIFSSSPFSISKIPDVLSYNSHLFSNLFSAPIEDTSRISISGLGSKTGKEEIDENNSININLLNTEYDFSQQQQNQSTNLNSYISSNLNDIQNVPQPPQKRRRLNGNNNPFQQNLFNLLEIQYQK